MPCRSCLDMRVLGTFLLMADSDVALGGNHLGNRPRPVGVGPGKVLGNTACLWLNALGFRFVVRHGASDSFLISASSVPVLRASCAICLLLQPSLESLLSRRAKRPMTPPSWGRIFRRRRGNGMKWLCVRVGRSCGADVQGRN